MGDWGLHLVQDRRNNQKHHCRVHLSPQPCNRWINIIYLWKFEGAKNTKSLFFHWCGVYGPNITPPKKGRECWFPFQKIHGALFFSFFWGGEDEKIFTGETTFQDISKISAKRSVWKVGIGFCKWATTY